MITAARRQQLHDRYTELLQSWGSPHPADRATALIAAADTLGLLPVEDTPPVQRGPGSTPAARQAALAQIRTTLATRRTEGTTK